MKEAKIQILWDELLHSDPAPKDLVQVMSDVEPLRERAWKLLRSYNLGHNGVVEAMTTVLIEHETYRDRIWNLIRNEATADDLARIVIESHSHRSRAWKQLEQRCWAWNNRNKYLLREACEKVMIRADSEFANKAWREYKRLADLNDLSEIAEGKNSFSELAWDFLMQKDRNDWQFKLTDMLEHNYARSLHDKAARTLLDNNPEEWSLRVIIMRNEKHREEAAKTLLARKPANCIIHDILVNVPSLHLEAVGLMFLQGLDGMDISTILIYAEDYREAIGKYIVKYFPVDHMLDGVDELVPSLKEEVALVRAQRPRETSEIISLLKRA